MWRPFASDFVSHTYDEFQKKHDKMWTPKPIKVKPEFEKFDPQKLFPNKLGLEELSQRENEFIELKVKVEEQRKAIKQRDLDFANNQKEKILQQKEKESKAKKNQKQFVQKIRSISFQRNQRKSQCFGEHLTFPLTSVDRSRSILKNQSFRSGHSTAPVNFSNTRASFIERN